MSVFNGWAKPKKAKLYHCFEQGRPLCGGPWQAGAGKWITVDADSRPCGICRKRAEASIERSIREGGKKLIAAIFG